MELASLPMAFILQNGAPVAGLLLLMVIYNRLVRLRSAYRNAFSQIDVQLKRRYDLIPNLVESAKRVLKHDQQALERVISARNQAARMARSASGRAEAEAVMALVGAEAALSEALQRLFAVVEGHPDLKADLPMQQLSEALISTENRIDSARQAYNDAVISYNTRRESLPDVLAAAILGFRPARAWERVEK